MNFNEFRDDVVLTLDANPESALRRVATFDKGKVLQIAVPRFSASSGLSPWDGIKMFRTWDEAWIDRLLGENVLVEQTIAGEQVYVLIQRPPLTEELPPTPPSVATGIGGELVAPNADAVPPALDALTKVPNAEDLAHGDSPAGGTDGEIKEDTADDLGESKPAESVEDEQPKSTVELPPAKVSAEPKSGKPKNK